MLEWFLSLPMDVSLFISALIGMAFGAIVSWFGEILTPDDLV